MKRDVKYEIELAAIAALCTRGIVSNVRLHYWLINQLTSFSKMSEGVVFPVARTNSNQLVALPNSSTNSA